MSAENSAANQTSASKPAIDNFTKSAAFFDATWQLALTVEFYFQYAIIAIGIFGTAANAVVLYALISHNAGQAKKRAVNLLIINQNLLDLACCVLLVISFSVKVANIHMTGTLGYFVCTLFVSEMVYYCAINGSVINLMSVTVERYLKVVHPFSSKKHLKPWTIYAAIVFAWVGGTVSVAPVTLVSTVVQDGFCASYSVWESRAVRMAILLWTACSFFLMPVVVFVYCYGRIVVVLKRQMRVMAGHGNATAQPRSALQIQNKRIKWNIIKTMIIVSVVFVVCWFPLHIFWIIVDNTASTAPTDTFVGYYATVFLAYLNISLNPFIYASKHDGVKQRLASIMKVLRCGRHNDVTVASGDASARNRSNRAAET